MSANGQCEVVTTGFFDAAPEMNALGFSSVNVGGIGTEHANISLKGTRVNKRSLTSLNILQTA